MTNLSASSAIKIWDVPTRLFHWLLVAGLGFMWWTAEQGGLWMIWHIRVGVLLLALVLTRIIWGFVGSDTARFSSFIRSPIASFKHLRELPSSQPAYHLGHNPLGAWMVLALLAAVLTQIGTGLFATDDIFVEGPLHSAVSSSMAKDLTSLHKSLFDILLLLSGLHILAIVYYALRKRTHLVKAMITGKVNWPEQQPKPKTIINFKNAWLALVLLVGIYLGLHFLFSWLA